MIGSGTHRKSLMICMIAAALLLYWGVPVQAEYQIVETDNGISLVPSGDKALKASAPMPASLKDRVRDDELFIAINASSGGKSLTGWLANTLNGLTQDADFRTALIKLITDMFDDPATPEHEPILDMGGALPLFGDINVGLHFQDIYNSGTGPWKIPSTDGRTSTGFGDADAVTLTVNWPAAPIEILAVGSDPETTPLMALTPTSDNYDGSLSLKVTLNDIVLDVMLRQPDYPKMVTSGYYVHALGKIRVPTVSVAVRVFSIGGNFATAILENSIKGGYGIGVDIDSINIEAGIELDLDEFNCNYNGTWGGYSLNSPFCDVNDMLSTGTDPHPNAGDQAAFTVGTNDASELLAEVLQFVEGEVFIDAQRSALASVQQYLTALEVTDVSWFTHTRDLNNTYGIPLEHPFEEGASLFLDYGFMYRFHGHAPVPASPVGIDAPGGFAFGITGYDDPHSCTPVAGAGKVGRGAPIVSHGRLKYSSMNPGSGNASMIGVGVHVDPLNEAIDSIWESGLGCMDIYADTKGIGSSVQDIFKAGQFKMFLPSLLPPDDRNVMVRFRPRFSDLNDTYVQATDQPKVVLGPADPANLIVKSTEGGYVGPFDVAVQIPHLETRLAVDTSATGDGAYSSFTDIFAADVGLDVYLALGWYKTMTSPTGLSACDVAPYPCRILHVGAFIDPQVNDIKELDVASTLTTGSLRKAIASVIPLVLSGEYEGSISAAINTSPTNVVFLDLVIDPTAPGDTGWEQGAGVHEVDADGDGDKDYLGIYLSIGDVVAPFGEADVLGPAFIMDQLRDFGLFPPAAPSMNVRKDPWAQYREQGMLKVEHHVAPETFVKVWSDAGEMQMGTHISMSARETRLAGISSLGGTVFVAPDSVEYAAENLSIQWRLDNQYYSIPSKTNRIELPYLFDGKHRIEVHAIDDNGFIDGSAAILDFTIDTQKPNLRWVNAADLTEQGVYRREIRIGDAVTPREMLTLEYSVDGSPWQKVEGFHEVRIPHLSAGTHTIEVRALDENANVAVISDTVGVNSDGFGCSTTGGSAPLSFVLMILLPALFFRKEQACESC